MDKHPIQSLMSTTMENIKDMVDVNTVVGDPVMTNDGTTIIPISRVSFGFVSGGGEYNGSANNYGAGFGSNDGGARTATNNSDELPFAGGTGAGVSVHPMGFLVVGQGQIKMLPTNYATPVDRVMELLPQVLGEIKDVLRDDSGSVQASTAQTVPVATDTIHPTITEHVHYASSDNKYENKHSGNADKKFSSYGENKNSFHDHKPSHTDNK